MRWLSFFFVALVACNTATLRYPPEAGMEAGPEDAGALPFPATSKVRLIVEPSDNGAAILSAIQNAQKSVHMSMYLLSNNSIMGALIARKKAGVDVKVILNKTFPDPGFDNTPEFDTLANNGVPVTWAPASFTYSHAKTVVIDGTQVWIMTMNLTFSSPVSNREYLVVDEDPQDIAEAESIFAADFVGQPAAMPEKLVVAPVNARTRMAQLFSWATQTIDVEAENFSDTGVVGALVAAKNKGVTVRVVVSDQTGTQAMMQAVAVLKGAGIPVVKLSNPYQHAKAIVVDAAIPERAVGLVGSQNFTQNSIDSNREVGVVLVTDVDKLAATIDADFKAGTAL